MQAAVRQAGCLAQGCSLLQQAQPAMPALVLQLTSLMTLSRSSNSSGEQRCWQHNNGGGRSAATGSRSSSGAAAGLALILLGQQLVHPPLVQQHLMQQQRRPIFNFAGFGGDLSKSYHEKKLLGWTPRQVYDVVAGVEHYAYFVPWCQRSTVMLRQPPGYLEAELEVGFQMFVERYTSKVTLHCPTTVHSKVEDSTLFSHLTNKWEFRLGPTPHTTWLTFEVDFAFKSPLYRQVASIFFEEVVQRMMGAFEGRCTHMYGPSSLHRRPRHAQHVAAGGR